VFAAELVNFRKKIIIRAIKVIIVVLFIYKKSNANISFERLPSKYFIKVLANL
jgi:hypothetical protein